MSLADRIRAGMRANRVSGDEMEAAVEMAGVLRAVQPAEVDTSDDDIIRHICGERRIRYHAAQWQVAGGGAGGREGAAAARRRSPGGGRYGAQDDFPGADDRLPIVRPRAEEVAAYRRVRGGGDFAFLDPDRVEGKCCICCACCLPVLLLIMMFTCVTVVPVGSVGVKSNFGSVAPEPLPPGWHFIIPGVSKITLMSIQLQVATFADKVPTSEGLNVVLEARALYRLQVAQAVTIYREVGMVYESKIIMPQFAAIVRDVTAAFAATDLYNAQKREQIVAGIQDHLRPLLKPRGIVVEETLVNKLLLPHSVETAIEKKMTKLQQAEGMKYVLEKERKQAQQKVIKATGMAGYSRIIAASVTDRLLLWAGINATTSLATSNCNPKLVVVGAARGANKTEVAQAGLGLTEEEMARHTMVHGTL